MFENTKLFFKKQIELIEQIKTLSKMLKINIHKATKNIEELEQYKLYYIDLTDISDENFIEVDNQLRIIKQDLKWTIPNIVCINKKITELTLEELNQLIKIKKQQEAIQ